MGHRRLEGPQQLEQLCQLYAALRLFTNNIDQPSAKRIPFEESEARDDRRPRRRHDQPLTPADRLLGWSGLKRKARQQIEALQQHCDPVALLETIRSNQSALVNGEQAMQRLEREQPGLYGGSVLTLQRRMAKRRLAHDEQVVGQQMAAIRDLENS